MPAHQHLHLLIPSSTPSISLEVRLYLPDLSPTSSSTVSPHPAPTSEYLAPLLIKKAVSTYSVSTTRLDELDQEALEGLKQMGVERVVIAAHPWGRLGGSMLDPIISQHLLSAIYTPSESADPALVASPNKNPLPKTALLTYNVRGVGLSQGSLPWLGVGSDPVDFGVVESTILNLFGVSVTSLIRFGYSWGCLLVALAPPPPSPQRIKLDSILLISPPITIFRGITLISSKSFQSAVREWVEKGVRVGLIHGTKDEFTSVKTFRDFGDSMGMKGQEKERRVERIEIDDADHLFRRDEGEKVREEIGKWIGWVVRA